MLKLSPQLLFIFPAVGTAPWLEIPPSDWADTVSSCGSAGAADDHALAGDKVQSDTDCFSQFNI